MPWLHYRPDRNRLLVPDVGSPERGPGLSRRGRRLGAAAVTVGLAVGVAAGSGAIALAPVSAASGPLVIGDLAPFTGPDAALGGYYVASCLAATHAINGAGGVLGQQMSCQTYDTRGDPADAVPAANQMFATTPNLTMVIGCTSDEAATVVPIINSHKMVAFCMTGQSEFDHVKYPYFFRLVPPDLAESYAMVAIAKYNKHYKKIALAFGNDIGSQTFVNPAIAAIKKAGLKLAANVTLDLSANTFRTEAETVVQSHPSVIVTEALGAADATFLSEVKQLNGGKMIPIIGTSATIDPSWFSSVGAAIGKSTLASNYVADNLVVATSGPEFTPFNNAMQAVASQVTADDAGSLATLLSGPGAVHLFDGMNLAALAMVMSKSTNPSVYKADILKIGDGVKGAVVVHSFAQGKSELAKGKAIRYIGPGGPTSFDAYHDSPGILQIDGYKASGAVTVNGGITVAQLRAVS
ncbi:MAG TPA: ABC transporter substrate-binding protein [Candidatus Dormibacteraeota bacterium]|nr:ABC transporter substrate-binding protein [Candidatus Dormibacteraeota bacterium]